MGYISKEEFQKYMHEHNLTLSYLKNNHVPKDFLDDVTLLSLGQNTIDTSLNPKGVGKDYSITPQSLMDAEEAILLSMDVRISVKCYKQLLFKRVGEAIEKREEAGNYWGLSELLSYLSKSSIGFPEYKNYVRKALPALAEKKVEKYMKDAGECADSLEKAKPENYHMIISSISCEINNADEIAKKHKIEIQDDKEQIIKKAYKITVIDLLSNISLDSYSSRKEAQMHLEMALQNSRRLNVSIDKKSMEFIMTLRENPDCEEVLKGYKIIDE